MPALLLTFRWCLKAGIDREVDSGEGRKLNSVSGLQGPGSRGGNRMAGGKAHLSYTHIQLKAEREESSRRRENKKVDSLGFWVPFDLDVGGIDAGSWSEGGAWFSSSSDDGWVKQSA